MLVDAGWGNTVDVPCHVEEELQIVSSHLGVMDVGNPQFTAVVVVGSLHLAIDKARLCRRQPQIVVRTAPIAQMIVDTTTSRTLLLLGIRETCHVAVVVVTPHQRDVIGYAKSAL